VYVASFIEKLKVLKPYNFSKGAELIMLFLLSFGHLTTRRPQLKQIKIQLNSPGTGTSVLEVKE
jgi:hypothetical protein